VPTDRSLTRRAPRRRSLPSLLLHLIAAAAVLAGLVVVAPAALGPVRATAQAAGPCDPGGNPVVCENSKPGAASSEWDVSGGGDTSVEGFATDMSVDAGDTVRFKVKADADYTVDIYRIGYYGGDGARKVASVPRTGPLTQPSCLTEEETGLVDCGNWSVSAAWSVPVNAVSGVYVANLVRTDTGGNNQRPSSSSSATMRAPPTCCSRPRTRPGRPTTTTATTASTSGGRSAARTRSATTARSVPA
jgi:hypothetical protein